jgi:hypothetical protein
MTKQDKFDKKLQEDMQEVRKLSIKPGSPEMDRYLAAGFAPDVLSHEQAELIIADWKKDHTSYPYAIYQKALAYDEAFHAKPSVKDIYHPPTNVRGQVVEAGSSDAV